MVLPYLSVCDIEEQETVRLYLFQIIPGMAAADWLSGFADKAETLLNQLDRGAADALSTRHSSHAVNLSNMSQ